MSSKRIYRSDTERVIGGVCGGIGEYFNVDPTWVRVLFVLSIFAKGLGLLGYLIAWIVIPRRQTAAVATDAVAQATPAIPAVPTRPDESGKRGSGFLPGVILVALGGIFLMDRAFYWFDFDYVWPLVIIGIGGALIFQATKPARDAHTEANGVHPAEVENGGR
jgi:phage shock protein PspC (stress-responsive transcriptional regulator)